MAEGNKLLNLGEKVRENPKTILLSIPILAWAAIWLGITGDKEGQAGAYGHLGLTFKLMYKHGGRNPTFHKIAYNLFLKAESLSTGNGRPTIILKKAQILGEMGNWKEAESQIKKAAELANGIKDEPQYAYLLAHLGRVKVINNDLNGAKETLDKSLNILSKYSKESSDMHIQVWMTTVELGLAEWNFVSGNKEKAISWANKVVERSEKYDLKTREVDGLNLLKEFNNNMDKVLIISGPTGVGKTGFALEIAQKFDGELISADSRQVYEEMDIITGKDLPVNAQFTISDLQWKGRSLKYYLIQGIKVWGYDVVKPEEEFNVSYWRECTKIIIGDILSRKKLPIIVGGTGLYIRSLVENLSDVDVPHNPVLRNELANFSTEQLFDYLKNIDEELALELNESDRKNPRRLVRKIEIAMYSSTERSVKLNANYLQVGLTAPIKLLDQRIDLRVQERIANGARQEFERIRSQYDLSLPSLTASGYRDWEQWSTLEKQYARRQLIWFKKFGDVEWFDITDNNWAGEAEKRISEWYN